MALASIVRPNDVHALPMLQQGQRAAQQQQRGAGASTPSLPSSPTTTKNTPVALKGKSFGPAGLEPNDGRPGVIAPPPAPFSLKQRRLYGAAAPSFGLVLHNTKHSSDAATTYGATAAPAAAGVRTEITGGRFHLNDAVRFGRETPAARLVWLLNKDPKGLAVCAADDVLEPAPEMLMKSRDPDRHGSQHGTEHDGFTDGASASPGSVRLDHAAGSSGYFSSYRTHSRRRSPKAHEPPTSAAAPIVLEGDVPAYMRPLNRSPRRHSPPVSPASLPLHPPSLTQGRAWGVNVGIESLGHIVGAVRVQPAYQHETGFLAPLLYLVHVTHGRGLHCEPAAGEWARRGLTTPADWLALVRALALRLRSGVGAASEPGDLLVVPASDVHHTYSRTTADVAAHCLRASAPQPHQLSAEGLPRLQASTPPPPPARASHAGGVATALPPVARTPGPARSFMQVPDVRGIVAKRKRQSQRAETDARVAASKAAGMSWAPPM
jgi:hypothetical protein